jgi:hypothetical protein
LPPAQRRRSRRGDGDAAGDRCLGVAATQHQHVEHRDRADEQRRAEDMGKIGQRVEPHHAAGGMTEAGGLECGKEFLDHVAGYGVLGYRVKARR